MSDLSVYCWIRRYKGLYGAHCWDPPHGGLSAWRAQDPSTIRHCFWSQMRLDVTKLRAKPSERQTDRETQIQVNSTNEVSDIRTHLQDNEQTSVWDGDVDGAREKSDKQAVPGHRQQMLPFAVCKTGERLNQMATGHLRSSTARVGYEYKN